MKENMFYGAGSLIFKRAEELRKNMTSAERIIWNHIHVNEWKLKFRRQHPISNFIVDFYCHALKLVIEIDDDIHDIEEVKKDDVIREKTLTGLGLKVIRFNNEEVYKRSNDVLKKIDETIRELRNSPLGDGGKNSLFVIKIGGNIIDDETKLSLFLKKFANIDGNKILVHGGGKLATNLGDQLGIASKYINGRRITDEATIDLVTMVYGGLINKKIVAKLQSLQCNAIGLTGADANIIPATKRPVNDIDYGFVGDIATEELGFANLSLFLMSNLTPIIAPLTHDGKGQMLNTNADTIASSIAVALSIVYDVQLIYSFEKSGVLIDVNDDSSVINSINPSSYHELKSGKKIFEGMMPKLDNAFTALNKGVKKVIIGKAEELQELINGTKGTALTNE